MTDMTIENNDKKTKQTLWKTELEELKKQRSNKALPVPVQRLIDGEISKLEERLGRWDEYTTLLGKTRSKVDRLSQKLSNLKKSQRECEIFLGIDSDDMDKPRPKFVVEDVVSFIKKNGGSVTYGQLSQQFGLGRLKLKKNIDKNSSVFKTDSHFVRTLACYSACRATDKEQTKDRNDMCNHQNTKRPCNHVPDGTASDNNLAHVLFRPVLHHAPLQFHFFDIRSASTIEHICGVKKVVNMLHNEE